MPEGHTIHRLAAEHLRMFGGRRVRAGSPQGRFAEGARLLDGLVLREADAHGKHLLLGFGEDRVLHVHLGIYGKYSFGVGAAPDPVGAVRLRLVSGAEGDPGAAGAWADLRGPNACEVLDPGEVKVLRDRLGADPLRADSDPDVAWRRISRSRASVAVLLMDQSVVAGPGNIYRAEVLFRQGVHPEVAGRALGRERWSAIWADLRVLMADGVRSGRIDTVRAEHMPEAMGRPPRVDDHGGEVYVYRRAGLPCLVCGCVVRTEVVAGRNLFWCPGCQPAVG
ncbi:DNA-formamidopyrimidine glycosylase family protein [Spirillospora sp. NPDC029432]|uniref:Fpg/Nei family DNA glycosylase n=1 Tax=Spirillospora sp. NPDC029432 TaxID=3154599 RepID=UPI0034555CA8